MEGKRRVSGFKFPSELSSERRRWLARFSKETTEHDGLRTLSDCAVLYETENCSLGVK